MNDDDLLTITNAHNRIERIRELGDQFIEHVAGNLVPEGIPATLDVDNTSLRVTAFGKTLTAEPRVVRSQADYLLEYVFEAKIGDDEIVQVATFYLSLDGHLYSDSECENRVCDYNNRFIAKYICGNVALGAINSRLFEPSPGDA